MLGAKGDKSGWGGGVGLRERERERKRQREREGGREGGRARVRTLDTMLAVIHR